MFKSIKPEIREDYHALVRQDVFSLVPVIGGTLLDIGGGIGKTASTLKCCGNVDRAGVIDLVSPTELDPEIDFHCVGSVEDTHFLKDTLVKEGPFNVILCLDVLEHLQDPWAVVEILHSSLAENGVIIASIPNMRYYKATVPLFFLGKWELEDAGIRDRTHLRWFVKKTGIELMTSSGLVLEEVQGKRGGGRKLHLIDIFTFGLLRDFINLQYLIRVRNRHPQK